MKTEHMLDRMVPPWAYHTRWSDYRLENTEIVGASGTIKCGGCGRSRVTMLKREGRYICKDCWNTLQRIRAKSVWK